MPTPRVTLRRATSKDLSGMVAVENASFPSPEVAFDPRQIRRLIANPRAIVLVALAEGRLIGWASGLIRRASRRVSGRVYSLAVHPDARGLGLGRRLLQRLMRLLRQNGATRLSLEVDAANLPAIRLYESVGFSGDESLPHYYGKGYPGRRMRWSS